MPKAVDCVEGGIDFSFEAKVGHVSDDGSRCQAVPLKSFVAKLDGVRIQVVSGNGKAGLGKLDDQTPRSTSGFKQLRDFSLRMLFNTVVYKIEFGFPVGTEDEIVILRVVIQVPCDDFRFDEGLVVLG